MNLFNLNEKYDELLSMLEDEENELDPQLLQDTLDSIEEERDVKWDNLASLITYIKSQLTIYQDRKRTYDGLIKRAKKEIERLDNYLVETMDDAGVAKLEGENNIIRIQNYRKAVVIDDDDPGNLNPAYLIRQEILKPDKKLIYNDLSAGKEVQGAHLKPNRKAVIK